MTMPSLVVLGASGFVGRYLVESRLAPMRIKAISRSPPPDVGSVREGLTWFSADLLNPTSLNSILDHGDIVLNLVFMSGANNAENLMVLNNVIEACLRFQVTRLIHCSTAVVVGAAQETSVSELTPCIPTTSYERIKLALEECVLSARSRGLDVGILRPTAIIGPGGKNLHKLARSLQRDNAIIKYLRASLFGQRRMHLVPVIDVVRALLHLASLPITLNGNIYILSADDDPENNFRHIESILIDSLELQPRKWPVIMLPSQFLALLLTVLGRSGETVNRIYDCTKIRATEFTLHKSISEAVREFGVDFRKKSVCHDRNA